MSVVPHEEPTCTAPGGSIELVIRGRPRDLGGFSVARVLPSMMRRLVGPFIFFDHLTPNVLAPGQGMDVRPHPHIGLATVTYLFEGEIVHRDSLGSQQTIAPGDVNWMRAGRGIVHSERTGGERRRSGGSVHGIQSWVALPAADEESAPAFEHHPRESLPLVQRPGARVRILAGHSFGARSPVGVRSPTHYAHVELDQGADLPITDEHEERAAYVVEGTLACEGATYGAGSMLVFRPGAHPDLRAMAAARVMLLGGAPLEGPRHIFWNFVATTKDRIERAKQEWKQGAFPKVPGDEVEFIPLPD